MLVEERLAGLFAAWFTLWSSSFPQLKFDQSQSGAFSMDLRAATLS
jgi:hypothetical protein